MGGLLVGGQGRVEKGEGGERGRWKRGRGREGCAEKESTESTVCGGNGKGV